MNQCDEIQEEMESEALNQNGRDPNMENEEDDGDGEVMDGLGLEIVGTSIGSLRGEHFNGVRGGANVINLDIEEQLEADGILSPTSKILSSPGCAFKKSKPSEDVDPDGVPDESQSETVLNPRSQELKHWLEGVGMVKYFSYFEEYNLGLSDLRTMTNNALKAMGISSDVDRERLLECAADDEVEEEIGGDGS
mmetsp:Transcript_88370/g.153417  ORF Transcript_88370/g.153417 Transcript_88370/m.153417 type:complete len:193 (-) Transcript_88370:1191-1769(-)